MIYLRLIGGFGNQLFQYALYKHLQNKGIEVYLDESHYVMKNDKISIPIQTLLDVKGEKTSNIATNLFVANIFKYSFLKHLISSVCSTYYVERIPSLDYNLKQILHQYNPKKKVILEGYFQGYSLINKELAEDIYKMGTSELNDNLNKELLNKIKRSNNSVALHVRRGDYLEGFQSNVLDENYYFEAIRILSSSLINDFQVYVFSDDIDWCKKTFTSFDNLNYVQGNYGENSFKDLFLMANCNHNIISASTFSWWASILNPNPNKMIIAPKFWYKSPYRYKENFNLRMPGWKYL